MKQNPQWLSIFLRGVAIASAIMAVMATFSMVVDIYPLSIIQVLIICSILIILVAIWGFVSNDKKVYTVSGVVAFLVAALFLLVYIVSPHYVKEDIDDIVYAEPTQEAKDFDIEAHINSLPQVEYEKIDYPVKETYTYNFNGYKMTIDIPEGFKAYEIPLTEKPKVRKSKGLEDSCERTTYDYKQCGNDPGFMKNITITSDNYLCITDTNFDNENAKCSGISFGPGKSSYKGISLRDKYVRINTHLGNYNRKNITKNHSFLVDTPFEDDEFRKMGIHVDRGGYDHSILISDDLSLSFGVSDEDFSQSLQSDENLYFSIIDSIKIQKQ